MPQRPLRLVIVGTVYPYRGGIAHFMETMVLGLRERGHEVLPITFSRQYPGLVFPGKSQMEEEREDDPVGAERLIDSINPWTWWSAAKRIEEFKPDAIIFKYWMPFFAPAFGTILRRATKANPESRPKSICVVHNAIPHEKRPFDTALSRWFLGKCDGLVSLSDQVIEDLAELGVEAPVRRINHPIYDIFGPSMPKAQAREALGLDPQRPLLLFFGFIRAYKGLKVLLEAMPRILKVLPDAQLLVCGEFYEDEAPYREMIERLELKDSVMLKGDYLPNEEVGAWFCAADVVVQPYITATQSGVAQVAFQFERPSIISAVGGLPEIVPNEKAGLLVPPGDVGALAAAVIRYFQEDWEDRLVEGVREERKKYSWEHLYIAIEELIG